jgi:SnoaL-like protein
VHVNRRWSAVVAFVLLTSTSSALAWSGPAHEAIAESGRDGFPLIVEISQAALDAERKQAMSYSISTLLTRNLHDVFGENDPARRRAAIDEIFTEDCVFYEPRGVYRGRDEIDRVAGAIKTTHPDFRYQPIAGPEELGNGGRIQWVSGRPGEAPAYAGTDFIIARDGRIAAVYLFFDKLP